MSKDMTTTVNQVCTTFASDHREAPSLAIEVVGAVDREWTETWNVGPASSGRPWNVVGDWMLTIEPGTRIRTLRRDLPQLLVSLEGIGVSDVRVRGATEGHRHVLGDELADALEALGVHSLACIDSAGSGKVHMTMPGQGGMVHVDGNLIADWVVRFLTHEEQADVLHKLSLATRARRREVFIAVTLMGAPWAVTSYLTDRPREPPWSLSALAERHRRRVARADSLLPRRTGDTVGRRRVVTVPDPGTGDRRRLSHRAFPRSWSERSAAVQRVGWAHSCRGRLPQRLPRCGGGGVGQRAHC